MLLEKLGKKFAKGAKAEILEPKDDKDFFRFLEAGISLLELGIFALAMFSKSGSSSVSTPTTIVVNNYITGGKEK